MGRKIAIWCIRCGKFIGWQEVSKDFVGNCMWDYCPECDSRICPSRGDC